MASELLARFVVGYPQEASHGSMVMTLSVEVWSAKHFRELI
jgi:hypothetical protein